MSPQAEYPFVSTPSGSRRATPARRPWKHRKPGWLSQAIANCFKKTPCVYPEQSIATIPPGPFANRFMRLVQRVVASAAVTYAPTTSPVPVLHLPQPQPLQLQSQSVPHDPRQQQRLQQSGSTQQLPHQQQLQPYQPVFTGVWRREAVPVEL